MIRGSVVFLVFLTEPASAWTISPSSLLQARPGSLIPVGRDEFCRTTEAVLPKFSDTAHRARNRKRCTSLRMGSEEEAKSETKESKAGDDKKDVSGAAPQRLVVLPEFFEKGLPNTLYKLVQKVFDTIWGWRNVGLSFVAGVFMSTAVLFVSLEADIVVPGRSTVMKQPLALMERILEDLNDAYVDDIDVAQLTDKGIAAMVQTLDPYTEYEPPQQAQEMSESIDGKYGGVGLVIAGATGDAFDIPQNDPIMSRDKDSVNSPEVKNSVNEEEDEEDEDVLMITRREQQARARRKGIRVVNALENYAFDYGIRVGDKIVAVDDVVFTPETTVEQVRNRLRGEPGTVVRISFERSGVEGVQTVSMPRSVVRLRDVKCATLLDNNIGYIQLSGFTSEAGQEVRNAIRYLQQTAEDRSGSIPRRGPALEGLVLDLRGNPGGLLTSAVDVASLLVPKDSDIVSAQGRGFPHLLYRSRVDPLLSPQTRLAVLVNRQTASAAEIVSGAVQDLDVGIVVGTDRTFGKGLVQNVEELPFGRALKYTVAKYYTPSGRCIQGVTYQQNDQNEITDSSSGTVRAYTPTKVLEKDRQIFYTRNGRVVRDGGGIEADLKIPVTSSQSLSALEVTLLQAGAMSDFASEWSKSHELTQLDVVNDETYRQFQKFVLQQQRDGEIQLELLYNQPLQELKKSLQRSGYKSAETEVESLRASILRDIQRDFERYKSNIVEDVSSAILARYLPESMLIERGVQKDDQVNAAIKLLKNSEKFDELLARDDVRRLASLPNDQVSIGTSSDTLALVPDMNGKDE